MSTVRTILALATIEDWHLQSIDISHAYLNGKVDLPVYMEQPEGFIQGDSCKLVCLLNKYLYRSKQGGQQWNKCLHKTLTKLKFVRTYLDASLYTYECEGIRIIMLVFIDDIMLASKSESGLDNFITE